ncbi:MAG: glycine betaine ABC transporter substrate-binding protein [Actinobacteria bacterium]|nr:glycine betaine ABC transporter substrate-binding protein [Actinomycetota bacterium]
MYRHLSWPRSVVLLVVLVLALAACGGSDESAGGDSGASEAGGSEAGGSEAAGGGGEGLAQYDLSGVDVAVGSKDFTEQLVLGQIMVQAFEATGANVEDRVNLGGTNVARAALESGEIDVYMEYNGTGWTVHLGNEDPPSDPEQLTEMVREEDLEENDIHWLSRSPFNDTYGFASSPELTEEHGGPFTLEQMATYLEENPDTTVCLESEFPERPDGLVLFEEEYDYEVPGSQIEILDTGLIYTETAQNNCDFGEVFTTDGRIPALDLSVVEDPGVFILYNVSLNVRDETYQENPEAFDAIAEMLLSPLDNETMQELNRRVDGEGEDPDDVAREYLINQGLIEG